MAVGADGGTWLPLLLTPEARLLFLERSMFPSTEPRGAFAPSAEKQQAQQAQQPATGAASGEGAAAAAAVDGAESSAMAEDGTAAPATAPAATAPAAAESGKKGAKDDDEDPNRRPVVCCDLKVLDQLALMVLPEPWGLHNWCLQNYLRETFTRLIQQNRVLAFYPTGMNDPTALVFNTGLVTPQLVSLYAVVVPSASRVGASARGGRAERAWGGAAVVDRRG